MSSVREILSAIEKLSPDQFVKLRARMDQIAEQMWQKEHRRLSRRFREEGLTDDDVDQMILRRRYRSRPQ
jgi:hypothetical protein